jgi:hypothetical protein
MRDTDYGAAMTPVAYSDTSFSDPPLNQETSSVTIASLFDCAIGIIENLGLRFVHG